MREDTAIIMNDRCDYCDGEHGTLYVFINPVNLAMSSLCPRCYADATYESESGYDDE